VYVGLRGETKYLAKAAFESYKGVDFLSLSLSSVTLVSLVTYVAVGQPAAAPFPRFVTALRRQKEKRRPKEE